ncbi:putative zinc finger protein 66 [Ixodes scapularis]
MVLSAFSSARLLLSMDITVQQSGASIRQKPLTAVFFRFATDDSPGDQIPRHRCRVWECSYATDCRDNFIRHSAMHVHLDSPLTCCRHVFWTRFAARSHRERIHPDAEYFCRFCDRLFSHSVDLAEHLATHTDEASSTCRIAGCWSMSSSQAFVKVHERRVHGIPWVSRRRNAAMGCGNQPSCPCVYENSSPGSVAASGRQSDAMGSSGGNTGDLSPAKPTADPEILDVAGILLDIFYGGGGG